MNRVNGMSSRRDVDVENFASSRTATAGWARRTARLMGVAVIAGLMLADVGAGQASPAPREPAKPAPLRILVSNDDGIEAPGIIALAEALGKVGTVTVAAPVKDESGTSHAMTGNKLISVKAADRGGQRWFAVDAMPATCVRLAVETLMPERPDIVVAGVNKGENTGVVTFYSATVACAREASFLGIPAIAVHLQRGEAMDYALAASFTAAVVRAIAGKGLDKGVFLNINVPALPREKIRGILVAPQDMRPSPEIYEKRESRGAESVYWATYRPLGPGVEKTDTWAVREGFISIAPMTGFQTAVSALARLSGLEKLVW